MEQLISIKKTKQPQRSAALTPSRTPAARDHKGNITWAPTGRNTKVRPPKTVNIQVNSPSSMENKFDGVEEESVGVRPRVQSHHSSLSKVNKAWERSRIERSAAKKAAAAIAKALDRDEELVTEYVESYNEEKTKVQTNINKTANGNRGVSIMTEATSQRVDGMRSQLSGKSKNHSAIHTIK